MLFVFPYAAYHGERYALSRHGCQKAFFQKRAVVVTLGTEVGVSLQVGENLQHEVKIITELYRPVHVLLHTVI